jgi:adenine-specific DNA-methyltransferase
MSIEKINTGDQLSQSADLVQNNIDKLKSLFPEILTEGKIDFKVLQQVLGEELEEEEEYYRFTWAGKSQARREAHKPSTGTLRPAKEESLDWDTTQNVYIEGDNLEVLKLLQKSYAGKIKMIYIDPPYNTGKDFVYKDNYKDNLKNYQEVTGQLDDDGNKTTTNSDSDGRYHSNWLNMMYPRLRLARNLLKDDGVIFMSIDENEVDNLIKVGKEIFAEENHLSTLIWSLSSGPQAGHFTRSHEYVIVFCKKRDSLNYFKDLSGGTIRHGALKKISKVNPSSTVLFKKGSIRCETENISFSGEIGGSEKQYIKSDKMTFKEGLLNEDVLIEAGWAMKNQLKSWLSGEVTFDSKGQKVLRFYFNSQGILFYEKERGTVHPKTVLQNKEVGNTKNGSNDIVELFGENIMSFPKPVDLVSKLIKTVSYNQEDIILDFFAGSSTTAHSTIELNINDNINRKFIQVQLPEKTEEKSEAFKAGYKTISEIGKERIRRATEKIRNENPEKSKDMDLGFKVFKLDSSNIKSWDGNPENLNESLFDAVGNIKTDRTEEDVLYEILLKYGLDLTLPIEERIIEDKKVFNVGLGSLFICLADDITSKVAEGIGQWKEACSPEICRVIFKDNGFTDVEKTNSVQTLKRYGINEIRSI